MNPKDPHAHWNDKYLTGNMPWDRGGISPALADWIDAGELTPCRILVPGCGRGHEVSELARHGYAVTAIDVAPAALAHLHRELERIGAQAELVQADALTWQPEHPFDAVYEQTCLCALQREHWQVYAAQLHAWLRPGGRLYALFMQTGKDGGPPFHCALESMRELFPEDRWIWPEQLERRIPHPIGHVEIPGMLIRR